MISPCTTERQAHIRACVFAINTVFANQHPKLNPKFPETALKNSDGHPYTFCLFTTTLRLLTKPSFPLEVLWLPCGTVPRGKSCSYLPGFSSCLFAPLILTMSLTHGLFCCCCCCCCVIVVICFVLTIVVSRHHHCYFQRMRSPPPKLPRLRKGKP